MQHLASVVINQWLIDSSETSTPLIGTINQLLIQPEDLTIRLYGIGEGIKQTSHFVRTDQIQINRNGLSIVRSFDVVGERDDFVREQGIIKQHCLLIGYKVISNKTIIGRVTDYSFSSPLFRIEKIFVQPPIWQRIHTSHRIFTRKHIIEVDPIKKIVRLKDDKAPIRSRASQAMPA
ncbi:MAG: hypothetical protein WCI47_03140 [bacterium]